MRIRSCSAGIVLSLLLFSAVASAQPPAPAVELTLRTDRPEAQYAPGERAEFLIQARQGGTRLSGASVTVELSNDGFKPLEPARTLTLDAQGRASFSSTLDQPGFLQCRVTVKGGGQSATGLVAAGFDPERIRPAAKLPADFEAFWSHAKEELAGIPLDVKLTPVERPSEPDVSIYKLSLANVQESRVYGWLSVPKKRGPFPAVLVVPGAGVYPQGPATQFARLGALSLNISVHNMDVDLPASAYAEANASALKGYPQFGKSDRDKFYYRRVVLGCVRALDYLTSRTDWDTRHLAVVGSSQGGALSLITGGVDRRVTAIAANVPAMCDHTGYQLGRVSGWPQLGEQGKAAELDAITRTSAYYDAVNFARAFRGPALVGVGFIDRTCPPTTVYAAYNTLRGPKEIVTSPLMGHAVDPRFTRRQEAFLQETWAR
jgi:cephalosporin-C deacetylase-like acetyl esterase